MKLPARARNDETPGDSGASDGFLVAVAGAAAREPCGSQHALKGDGGWPTSGRPRAGPRGQGGRLASAMLIVDGTRFLTSREAVEEWLAREGA